jgi:hypothetical protein
MFCNDLDIDASTGQGYIVEFECPLGQMPASVGNPPTCSACVNGKVALENNCYSPTCLYNFQSAGNWALVRRVQANSNFHPAKFAIFLIKLD